MKTKTLVTIVLLILVALLLTSCSLRNTPENRASKNITINTTETIKNPPIQVYDYDVILSENARDVPPLISLSPDIPKIFRVENKRNTEATFAIPQLSISERIGSGEVKYIEVRPIRIGFYQMELNGASYGTFQVK